MSGNISTEEKCSVCKGKMIHNERRKGCFCEIHTEIAASRLFQVRFGKKINKRYRTYDLAYQFLMGLRYEKANKKARGFSEHDSNAAFDRYCQIGDSDDFEASQLMAKMRGKIVDFEKAKRATSR